MSVRQKLGVIFESKVLQKLSLEKSKVLQKLSLEKNVFTKKLKPPKSHSEIN